MRTGTFLLLALVAALAGCAGQGPRSATYGGRGCGPIEHPAEQQGGHLIGDATPAQPYHTVPPTSGWHSAGAPRYGVHGDADPLTEPEQVTVLELGGVVIAHHDIGEEARADLEALAAEHHRVVAVTPYDRLAPGEVAFTAWGTVQHCNGADLGAARAFVEEHAGGGPEH